MPGDRIQVKGIRVRARHGVLSGERRLGQDFVIDLAVEADLAAAAASDDLEDTIDYADLAARVAARVADERWNLLERVATRVAELVLEDPRVRRVEVTVHKPDAPLPVEVDEVAVTVVRAR